uniref:Link domain-containing protein n=1 Tax=Salarias fasciatus TaxID=181472 RepID=A0A672IHH8_SALFA
MNYTVYSNRTLNMNLQTCRSLVFPAADQSIAGVFLVTVLHLGNPQYFFNASEARSLCSSLGVSIATKEQVEKAITRGLETCSSTSEFAVMKNVIL